MVVATVEALFLAVVDDRDAVAGEDVSDGVLR